MKKILLFLLVLMNCFQIMPVVIKTGVFSPDFVPDGGSFDLSDDDLARLNSKILNDCIRFCEQGILVDDGGIPVDVHEEEFRTLLSLSSGEERLDAYEAENLPSLLRSADGLGIQNDEVLELLARKFLEEIKHVSWENIGNHLVVLGNFFKNNVYSRLLSSVLCSYAQPIELHTLSGHTDWIRSVSWSPDGTKVLAGSYDGTAKIWDAATGECLKTLSGHTGWVWSVSWSPDGSKVLTGSRDHTARIWDAETGDCLQTLSGHARWIRSVSWSPDGSKVLTGSDDMTARIWDAATGECLKTLSGHTWGIMSVSWSPDGAKVLTGSTDRTAKIWDLTGGLTSNFQQLFVIKAMQSGFDVRQYAEDSILRHCYDSLPTEKRLLKEVLELNG